MLKQIKLLKEKGKKELTPLTTPDQLSSWYQKYLGRKGELTYLMKQLGKISLEERPVVGKIINEMKTELQQSFDLQQENIRERKLKAELEFDDIDVNSSLQAMKSFILNLQILF